MASGGSSGRNSSGPRSFDFGSDDVLCAYDDFGNNQDPANGRRPDPSAKDLHESRMGRPLVSVYEQQDEYPKEELIDAVEKCMKKYADNLLRHLEGISGRLSQLEIYCYKLERSVGEFRADMIRDHGDTDTKLKSLEKHLQEVHRSIQILRDKQELTDAQKELTKLQLAPKESSTQSQKSEEASAPSSVPEPKRHDDAMEAPNLHLALALTHHNQVPMQQQPPPMLPHQADSASLGAPHDRYAPVQYYPHQSQALQPEMHYIQQPRPQVQDSIQVAPPPQQQQQQPPPTPQAFPQYQQQWPQPVVSQQFAQQVVAPAQQPAPQGQLARPRTPPAYLPYSHQPVNPETFAYAAVPQSGGSRPDAIPFGYGGSGGTQPQQQASSGGSFPSPYPRPPPQSNMQGYNVVYSIDGNRVQAYQQLPPSNIQGMQNQQVAHGGGGGGFHHPGAQRAHPYGDMIEKASSMGFPRDQVAGVVNRMAAESGEPVNFNALLDRLNSRPVTAEPPRAWSS